jgi:hypothetical protein
VKFNQSLFGIVRLLRVEQTGLSQMAEIFLCGGG